MGCRVTIMDSVRICAALRDVGVEIGVDGAILVKQWRAQIEALVVSGVKRDEAESRAFFEIRDRAKRERSATGAPAGGKRKAKR